MIRSAIFLNKNIKINNYSSKTKNELDFLKQLLKPFNRQNFYQEYLLENQQIKHLKRASVLVPICFNSSTNEYEYILTKRMDTLRTHKGQVCFPGGMKDDKDKNEIRTAYREANEEIGIEDKSLTFLAQLVPVCTSAGVLLTPVVAFLDKKDFKPKINKTEVDFMFELSTR
jgi:8-oxo-dGTP pyrophosphatase MutT (NUDIX family)